jgi:site-specific DNA recombinase
MTPKPLRAALYARYSTDKQNERSVDDQYARCEQLAAREGAKVVKRFADKGISGGTAQRPGYQAMLTSARAKEFDLIIVEDISRLWRNRSEFGQRSTEFEDLRVHMVTDVGDDTRRDGWGLTVQIKMAMAEHARREASYRTRRGLEGRAREGKSTGGKAYGYVPASEAKSKQIEINQEQAKVVRQIFDWRARGWNTRIIARKLNEDCVKPPGYFWKRDSSKANAKNVAREWKHTTVACILLNPKYKGEFSWGTTEWTRSAADSAVRSPARADASKLIRHSRPDLRIVPVDLWERAHKLQTTGMPHLKGKSGRKPGRGSAHWLGSILVCECGSNYVAYGSRNYICASRIDGGKCKNGAYFRRADVDQGVFNLLKSHLHSEDTLAAVQEQFREWVRELKRERQLQSPAASSAEVEAIDARIEELRKAAQKGPLTMEDLRPSIEKLQQERADALGRATGKADKALGTALDAAALLPQWLQKYSEQIERAIRGLSKPTLIAEAREETRNLLADGRIVLAPSKDHSAVQGTVRFKALGEHLLQLTGLAARVNKSGSGGRI